jgi:hypothetical protein
MGRVKAKASLWKLQ